MTVLFFFQRTFLERELVMSKDPIPLAESASLPEDQDAIPFGKAGLLTNKELKKCNCTPGENESIWHFASLKDLMKLLQHISTSRARSRVTQFFFMNANPMMKHGNITYRKILTELVENTSGEPSERIIVTGVPAVAEEIASERELFSLLLPAEGAALSKKLAEKKALEIEHSDLETKRRQYEQDIGLTEDYRRKQDQLIIQERTEKEMELLKLSQDVEEKYVQRVAKYRTRCEKFVNELSAKKKRNNFTLIQVYSPTRIPWFVFSVTLHLGNDEETILIQAFLDTNNVSTTNEGGSLIVPGVVSRDGTYNKSILGVCRVMEERLDREYKSLAPDVKVDLTVLMFRLGGSSSKEDADNDYLSRRWLYRRKREVHLAYRREDQPFPKDRIIVAPTIYGISVCLLGNKNEDKPEEKRHRVKRATDYGWRVLEDRFKSKEMEGKTLSVAVYQTYKDRLIWAPNGSVTICGNSLHWGESRLANSRDGEIYIDTEARGLISETP